MEIIPSKYIYVMLGTQGHCKLAEGRREGEWVGRRKEGEGNDRV